VFSALTDLSELPLLPSKEVVVLASSGFMTPAAVLQHFPKRYEDRRHFDSFPSYATDAAVCLNGSVVDVLVRNFEVGGHLYEVVIRNEAGGVFGSGTITCRWFNMPFIKNLIAVGHDVIVFGKIKDIGGRLMMDHPEFEILRLEDEDSIHIARIVPIYKNISGISQRRLREIMFLLVQQINPETLAVDCDMNPSLDRAEVVKSVHFPETLDEAARARRRFAFEEFFVLQLNVVWRRARYQEQAGRVLGKRTSYLKAFYAQLPFDLTNAQKRSIKEVLSDMRSAKPMNRLLQGDVGSGKTFVAMAAMLLAIESGCQAALMAPTQILAEQHYLTFCQWLGPLGIRVALITGHSNGGNYESATDEPQIIIGTHALLYDGFFCRDLGLIVIDEQHKFGVAQRASLIRKGIMPDVLVMTATPIPRTLTMTVYGDLDVSILDEKPSGRGKIITGVRINAKQRDVTQFVKAQLGLGRQVYLVYPLVEESVTLRVESAIEAFAKWQKRLSRYEVGLIHGKLRPEEKEDVMRRFRLGEIAALVATTVIEVGVDVPNASLMILHHAERFGLAQLHQLRGRIGRGGHKAYCLLLTDGKNSESLEKLKVIERTLDGFEVAEADLRMRGPGNVLGTLQSGLSELQFTDFLADTELLQEARTLAENVLTTDPQLKCCHARLLKFIGSIYDPSGLATTA
jgi:ATP-dependent DNA helicase RecG